MDNLAAIVFDDSGHLGYVLPMTDAELEEAEYLDDEEDLGPCTAFPPLYVLRAAARCPDCGKAEHVYALGCAAFHHPENSFPIECSYILGGGEFLDLNNAEHW